MFWHYLAIAILAFTIFAILLVHLFPDAEEDPRSGLLLELQQEFEEESRQGPKINKDELKQRRRSPRIMEQEERKRVQQQGA